ncbi:MAG: tetratricopeptide repeat protein [Symploca sp. SIO3E6]|nr:tetratricopeptide repeat protein [Caldora sp. SIO3E6]
MPRPTRKHKLYAELLVAALLTYLTWHPEQGEPPTIEKLIYPQPGSKPKDSKLKVKGTPDAFVALIKLCAQLPNFKRKYRKHLVAFQKLSSREEYNEIRDTVTTLGKYRLIQERTPRRRGNPNRIRDFILPLPLNPTSLRKQEEILSRLFAPGKAWDEAEWEDKSQAKQQETKEAVNPILLAQKAFCQAMATKVVPHLPVQLSDYTSETLTSLTKLISVLETATQSTASVDANHHAALLLSLGRIYLAQQQLDEAQKLFEQCITLKANSSATADSLHWLGIVHHQRGNYAQAEQCYINGLEQRTKFLGEKHPDVATSTHALAELYSDRGQFPEAETSFVQALSRHQTLYGKKHPRVACVLNGLATVYTKTNRLEQAEALYQEAFNILTIQPDSDAYPHLTDSQHGLANLYTRRGEYEKAEKLHRDAIEAIEQYYGTNHPNLAVHKASLAVIYKALGQLHQARELYIECLNLLRSVYGNNHPQVAIYLSDLAWLITEESKEPYQLKLALSFFQKSISILSRVCESNHPSLINARRGLNLICLRKGVNKADTES